MPATRRRLSTAALLTAACVAVCVATDASADTITLSTGEVLNGAVVSQNAREIVFSHAILGQMTLSRNAVASVQIGRGQAPPETAPADNAPADNTPAQIEPAPPMRTGDSWFDTWMDEWTTQIELGLNGSTGNSESVNLRAGFSTTYEDDADRWLFKALYQYQRSSGDDGKNEATVDLEKDWFFPDSAWFINAKSSYLFDQFQSWRHRVVFNIGPGYYFVKNDELQLRGLVQPGFTKDFAGQEEFTPELLIALELLKWKLDDVQTLSGAIEYRPGLDDLNTYRLNARAEYQLQLRELGEDFELAYFKIGAEFEHENPVEPEESRNDLDYYASLVFEF